MTQNSLEKMLSVLVFVEQHGRAVSLDEIVEGLSLTLPTAERHVDALLRADLLSARPDAGFALAARVTCMDFQARIGDPLIRIGDPLMTELVQAIPGIALLCIPHGDALMCVHQVRGAVRFESGYRQGLAQSLLKGAAARVVLAYLPPAQIDRLCLSDPEAFAQARLGDSPRSARSILRGIRRRGWESCDGELIEGVTGVAAPIFEGDDRMIGCLSLSLGETGLSAADVAPVVARVTDCARQIRDALAHGEAHAPSSRSSPNSLSCGIRSPAS